MALSSVSPKKSIKLETYLNALEVEVESEDESLKAIKLALQQTFSNVNSPISASTNLLPAKRKWSWALNQLVKKRQSVAYFRSGGFSTHLSTEARIVISSSNQNKEIQSVFKSKSFNEWGFDVFSIKHRFPLVVIAYEIMINRRQFHNSFGFSPDVFAAFLYRLNNEYDRHEPANLYHGAYHAADVLKSLDWILDNSKFVSKTLTDVEIFAMLIAAICHDVGHDGKNNAFHIQTQSELAITYHDMSPLENYHLSTAFRCRNHSDSNFMSSFPAALQQQIKNIMIKTILHTDMSNHAETINDLKKLLQKMNLDDDNKEQDIQLDEKEKMFLLSTILHFADISGPMKPFKYSLKCGCLVYSEFFEQGDEEKELGLNVTPLCDREKSDIIKGQIGFSKFVVQPLLSLMLFLFPEFEQMQTNMDENCKIYASVSALDDVDKPKNTVKDVQEFFANYKF